MAYFDWNGKLETGIAIIDEQHKKLISLVNELHEAMRNRKAKDVVAHILKELGDYTTYHFSVEEKAFEKRGYPNRAEHEKLHADLIAQLSELMQKQAKGELAISIDVLDFLTQWVTNHIMKEDMKYVPFLKDGTIEA
jgi:hemerythrin-like metal-binding protein